MRRSFRERNPIPLGIAGVLTLALVVYGAMNLNDLPLIGGGQVYSAAFAEAAGLKEGEEVRIAGVKVGTVEKVALEGDHVRVDFRIDRDIRLGSLTKAHIKLKTLLGAHYLALEPRGPGRQSPEEQIPVSRTTVPFEIMPAVTQLSRQVDEIDTEQLAKAFDTLSETFENSPEEVKASLRGLRRLSASVASRDRELHELLGRATTVSELLAERSEDITKLAEDGDKLLRVVIARRAVIHQLLVNTVGLAQQINGLIKENERQIGPALTQLHRVIEVLKRNEKNLEKSIPLLATFVNQLGDATGTGRWFDTYIQNFVPVEVGIGAPEGAAPGGGGGRGSGNGGGSGDGGERGDGRDGGRSEADDGATGGSDDGGMLPWLQ